MRSTGAVITEILETYGSRFGQMVKVSEIAEAAGLTPAEVADAVEELLLSDDFRAEPEAMTFKVTEADRRYAPVIGGEPRHLICFG